MLSVIYNFLPTPLLHATVGIDEIAMVICFGWTIWSATHSAFILRDLKIKLVDKLFWIGVTIIPFMFLIFLAYPN